MGAERHELKRLVEGFGRSRVIACDTGPLAAAADRDVQHDRSCTDLLTALHPRAADALRPGPRGTT